MHIHVVCMRPVTPHLRQAVAPVGEAPRQAGARDAASSVHMCIYKYMYTHMYNVHTYTHMYLYMYSICIYIRI